MLQAGLPQGGSSRHSGDKVFANGVLSVSLDMPIGSTVEFPRLIFVRPVS